MSAFRLHLKSFPDVIKYITPRTAEECDALSGQLPDYITTTVKERHILKALLQPLFYGAHVKGMSMHESRGYIRGLIIALLEHHHRCHLICAPTCVSTRVCTCDLLLEEILHELRISGCRIDRVLSLPREIQIECQRYTPSIPCTLMSDRKIFNVMRAAVVKTRTPLTLKELCRITIKCSVRDVPFLVALDAMPLPKVLKKYLCFEISHNIE